jgi:hypothetical protein
MAEPFTLRERWFDVSLREFEAFLRDYPPAPRHASPAEAESELSGVGRFERRTVARKCFREVLEARCMPRLSDPARPSAQGVGAGAENMPVV